MKIEGRRQSAGAGHSIDGRAQKRKSKRQQPSFVKNSSAHGLGEWQQTAR
jgi:hypothetical protein